MRDEMLVEMIVDTCLRYTYGMKQAWDNVLPSIPVRQVDISFNYLPSLKQRICLCRLKTFFNARPENGVVRGTKINYWSAFVE